MQNIMKFGAPAVAVALLVALTAGCPPVSGSNAKFTMLLAAGDDAAKADSSLADMEHFWITVKEISMNGPVESDGDEGQSGAPRVVYSGPVEVDLLNLTDVSLLLSEAEIPAGRYTRLTMEVGNPEVVLKDGDDNPNNNPVIPSSKIQLTANGRLFVSQQIDVPEGDNRITLSLNGLKLVRAGNSGRYVLTPQLQVTVEFEPVEVAEDTDDVEETDETETTILVVDQGIVVTANASANELEVSLLNLGTKKVTYTDSTPIYRAGDASDTPTGNETLFVFGTRVEITGALVDSNTIAASKIVVFPLF